MTAPDRRSYEAHNMARDERNRRRRAYKKLDPDEQRVIRRNIERLKIIGLSDMHCFDLIAAIGEALAKVKL